MSAEQAAALHREVAASPAVVAGPGGPTGRAGIVARVEQCVDRIADWPDPAVFISVAPRAAVLDAARRVAEDAPLAGLVFAVKDNIDVAGLPTTAACPTYRRVPEESAPVVARLEAAGAVCVGKTNLDQFATGLVGTRSPYGIPINPRHPELVPGGSSSGSAVAVAAGLVDFALGTDTAGSGRVPAAQCAIVGVKPTRGLLSTRGVVPAVRSLDCVSIFTRDVGSAMRVLAAAAGYDADDPFSRRQLARAPRPRPLRVGVVRHPDLDTDADRTAWHGTMARLADLGIEPVEIDLAPFLAAARLLYSGGWVAERYAAVGEFLDQAIEDGRLGIDPTVAAIISEARTVAAFEFHRSRYQLAALRRATERTWERVDVLLLPTTPGVATLAEVAADPIGRNSRLGTYTNFANLLDLCTLAVPGADRPDGRPFGVQIVGPAFTDATVASLAACLHGEHVPPDHGPSAFELDIVVVGAHLGGLPLNGQLTERQGRLVASTTTTAEYRLYTLAGTDPPKPGLVRVARGGAPIEVEVWRLPAEEVGSLLALVAPPLGLGGVRLADGTTRHGFLCEAVAVRDAADITDFGGWRAYLSAR